MAVQVMEQVADQARPPGAGRPAGRAAQQDGAGRRAASGTGRRRGTRAHRRAGEPACEPCAEAARELWRTKARRRFARVPEQIRDTNRRSRAKAVRCRVCGKVVREEDAVLVEPLRSARGPLTCHRPCAESRGRAVVTVLEPADASSRGAGAGSQCTALTWVSSSSRSGP